MEINGKNLAEVSAMLFGTTQAVFDAASLQKLVAIVPNKVFVQHYRDRTARTRQQPIAVSNDPRIPDAVSYKAG